MTVDLGFKPVAISVTLAYHGGFSTALVADTEWDVGAIIALHFSASVETAPTAVWVATINGATASWDLSSTAVQAVIGSASRTARLMYTDGSGDVIAWGLGQVHVI